MAEGEKVETIAEGRFRAKADVKTEKQRERDERPTRVSDVDSQAL
jgi:hypothetical protein